MELEQLARVVVLGALREGVGQVEHCVLEPAVPLPALLGAGALAGGHQLLHPGGLVPEVGEILGFLDYDVTWAPGPMNFLS